MCGRSVLRTARAATSDASRVSFLLEICNPTHEKVIEVRTQSDPWINKPKPNPCPPPLRRATRYRQFSRRCFFCFQPRSGSAVWIALTRRHQVSSSTVKSNRRILACRILSKSRREMTVAVGERVDYLFVSATWHVGD